MPTCKWASCPSISRSSGIQSLEECGIVELRLAVRFAHVAKRVQTLQDGLPARWGHLLPARKQRLPDVPLLLGVICSQTRCRSRSACCWSGVRRFHASRRCRICACCSGGRLRKRWLLRRNCSCRRGRQILKPLNGLGRQIIRIAPGRQRIGQPRPQLIRWGGRRWRALLLRGGVGSLPVRSEPHMSAAASAAARTAPN